MSYIGIDPDVMVFMRKDVSTGPALDLSFDLGSPIARWNNLYIGTLHATTINGVLDLSNSQNIEQIQDIVGDMITGNVESGIAVTYDDGTGKLNFNVGDPTLTLTGDVTGNATMTDLGNLSITTVVVDDSHNHTVSTITNFVEEVQDAIGTAINAGTQTGITVTYDDVNDKIDFAVAAGSGSGADADTVDGLEASQFLRSDTDDTMNGNLIITGDLTINGTTTTVNTETINLADNIILLNSNETGIPSQNAGIEIERGTDINVSFIWNETADRWEFIGTQTLAATFVGDLTGNADTATALQTSRNITLTGDATGSASFNGTADASITVTVVNDSHSHDTQYYTETEADTLFGKIATPTVYTAQQNFGQVTLTDAVNVSWDLNSAQSAVITLNSATASRQLDNPTNQVAGGTYVLIVKQDGTGTAAMTFGTAYKFSDATAPTITVGANAVDILTFISDGTNMYAVAQQNFG